MPNIVRNILAVIAGIVIGSVVNMTIVTVGPMIIPPPEGVDLKTHEGLKAAMPLFEPKHFISPFLAHALGTLVGALVAYLIAGSYKSRLAYVVGFFFLCGGVAVNLMIPGPKWFTALDLIVAYLPMAWLAIQIGSRMSHAKAVAA